MLDSISSFTTISITFFTKAFDKSFLSCKAVPTILSFYAFDKLHLGIVLDTFIQASLA
jgi:hypothetical protein